MEITEVRIKLMEDSDDRLQAFCSVTFDNAFVVRDLKIIDGSNGPFVAMPSRKLTSHCAHCGYKNHLRAHYCNQCGGRLREERTIRDADGRVKLYADIAHPINAQCRELIQKRVIAEFQAEIGRATQPGYVSRYDDDYGWEYDEDAVEVIDERPAAAKSASATPAPVPPSSAASSSAPPTVTAPTVIAPTVNAPSAPVPPVAPASAAISSATTPKSGDGEAEKKLDKKIVPQPAAHEPRAPHAPTATSAPPPKTPTGRAKSSSFGAGIFDDKS